MTQHEFDSRYYIKVSDLMKRNLPRPKHKVTVLANHDEWLPIIHVEAPV